LLAAPGSAGRASTPLRGPRISAADMPGVPGVVRRTRWADAVEPGVLAALPAAERQRQEVLHELLETERGYVADLQLVVTLFANPLRELGLVRSEEAASLFLNLPELLRVNQTLLASLEEALARPPGDPLYPQGAARVGEAFLACSAQFKLYAVYCANHPYIQSRLQALCASNSRLVAYLEDALARPECQDRALPPRQNGLQSLLILPVQRVCKYVPHYEISHVSGARVCVVRLPRRGGKGRGGEGVCRG
jgi:hypothetical protein